MKFSIFKILLIPLLVGVLNGCKSSDEDDGGSSSGSITPGVIDTEGGFYVKANPPASIHYYIHKDGDFSAPCVISSSATAHADLDISCILEVEELEGAYQTMTNEGIKMVMNTPPGMCRYVTYYPYFYFGDEYGTGPTDVTANYNASGVFIGGTILPPGSGYFTSTGTAVCRYDYSPSNGRNCCLGSYALHTVNAGVTTDSTQDWGGTPGNCAAGSGVDTVPLDIDTQLPLPVIAFKPNGFNDEFKTGTLEPIMPYYSSLYYANYSTGTAPTAFRVGDTYEANPYYEWACLDDAHEILARIRVQIREWNEISEFDLGSSGDPDTTGSEPNWGTPINDLRDWLDVVNSGNGYPGLL